MDLYRAFAQALMMGLVVLVAVYLGVLDWKKTQMRRTRLRNRSGMRKTIRVCTLLLNTGVVRTSLTDSGASYSEHIDWR